jgi:hypothetical protein
MVVGSQPQVPGYLPIVQFYMNWTHYWSLVDAFFTLLTLRPLAMFYNVSSGITLG